MAEIVGGGVRTRILDCRNGMILSENVFATQAQGMVRVERTCPVELGSVLDEV